MGDISKDELHILPTDKTPEFKFSHDGFITIRGRGLYGNNTEVSEQIMNWFDVYLHDPAEVTCVTLEFEYLNSFSSTVLVSILKKLLQVILQSKKLVVRWYYEEDDDDILERGEFISETFNIPIEFIITDRFA